MTTESFNNYVANLYYHKEIMADSFADTLKNGCYDCSTQVKYNIACELIKVIANWELYAEGGTNPNCVSLTRIKECSIVLNDIFSTCYNVDFVIN